MLFVDRQKENRIMEAKANKKIHPLLKEGVSLVRQRTILVVDDSVEYLKIANAILGECNYKLVLAKSGLDALRRLKQRYVDIILLDMEMPEMTGLQLFNILKSDPVYCTVPVIFVTAHADSDIITNVGKLGAKGYIVKPFKHNLLLSKVADVLSASPGQMAAIVLTMKLIHVEEYLVQIQKVRQEEKDTITAYEETQKLNVEVHKAFDEIKREIEQYIPIIVLHLGRISNSIENENHAHALTMIREFIDRLGVKDLLPPPAEISS
jgi:response regulator RpfG family c-di-GMP phosphodiesterase